MLEQDYCEVCDQWDWLEECPDCFWLLCEDCFPGTSAACTRCTPKKEPKADEPPTPRIG